MSYEEQATDQGALEERLRGLEQKVAKLEGNTSRPLGWRILLIVIAVAAAVLLVIGVNVDRPVPLEEQADPIAWTQTVGAGAVFVGSLGAFFLRIKGSPFWLEVIALTLLMVGALFALVAALAGLLV